MAVRLLCKRCSKAFRSPTMPASPPRCPQCRGALTVQALPNGEHPQRRPVRREEVDERDDQDDEEERPRRRGPARRSRRDEFDERSSSRGLWLFLGLGTAALLLIGVAVAGFVWPGFLLAPAENKQQPQAAKNNDERKKGNERNQGTEDDKQKQGGAKKDGKKGAGDVRKTPADRDPPRAVTEDFDPLENPDVARLAELGQITLKFNERRELVFVYCYESLKDGNLHLLKPFPNLKRLTLLSGISDASVNDLLQLAGLEELELFGANITNDGLARLTGLTKLRKLQIVETNSFSGPGLAHLAKLPLLTHLDMYNTGVQAADLEQLKGCKSLQVLTIPGHLSMGDVVRHIKDISSLTEFQFGGLGQVQKMTDDDLVHLAKLTKLQVLHLHAGITSKGLAQLRPLTEVRRLVLDEPVFDADWPSAFAGMKQLKEIYVARDLRGLDYAKIGTLAQLEKFAAVGFVKGTTFQHLKTLPRLKELNLELRPKRTDTDDGGELVEQSQLGGLGALEHLEKVWLRGRFDGTPFKNPSGLKKLSFVNMFLDDGTAPANLAGLGQLGLEEIYLDAGPQYQGIIEHLQGPASLRKAHLGFNVGDADMAVFSKCAQLEELFVTNGKLTDAAAEHIGKLTNLRKLSLGGTLMGDRALAALADLTRLEWLQMERTRITGSGLASLKPLARLEHLSLSGTPITDGNLAYIKELKGLRSLELSYTNIGDVGLAHLAEHPGLRGLKLFSTKVTDASLANLQKMRLRLVALDNSKMSQPNIRRLSRRIMLPGDERW